MGRVHGGSMKIHRDRNNNCRFKNHDHGGCFGFNSHAIARTKFVSLLSFPRACTVNAFRSMQKREVRVGLFVHMAMPPGVDRIQVVRAISRYGKTAKISMYLFNSISQIKCAFIVFLHQLYFFNKTKIICLVLPKSTV